MASENYIETPYELIGRTKAFKRLKNKLIRSSNPQSGFPLSTRKAFKRFFSQYLATL